MAAKILIIDDDADICETLTRVLKLEGHEVLTAGSGEEAVDIAKKFSTRESGAFVNGILDRLRADLPRPARTAAGTME